ncbi:hypothetical protein T09_5355 [Trichinella sp. T9]|nr:hypothetical protein T09_5355 [Trichinella sp. T9]
MMLKIDGMNLSVLELAFRRFGGLCFVHEKTKRIMQIWSEYVEELGNVNVEAFHGHCETFLHSYHSIISSEGLSDEVFHLLAFFTKMRYLTPEQFTSLLKILHTNPLQGRSFCIKASEVESKSKKMI